MTQTRIRVGTVGAGRVFERLYGPALGRVPGLELVAAADPAARPRAKLPQGVAAFESVEAMLAAGTCEAVLILSPGRMHAAHARPALSQGLPVLLEKPSAESREELESWPVEWRGLVTPARPRRYWPRYLALRKGPTRDASFSIALHTSPAAWGGGEDLGPEDDLLPHVVDLAGWLSRSEVAAAEVLPGAGGRGTFTLADGRAVGWDVAHGEGYREQVEIGGNIVDSGGLGFGERVLARVLARPSQAELGVPRMLRLWERRLRGEDVVGLPDFETALAERRFIDALIPRADVAGAAL